MTSIARPHFPTHVYSCQYFSTAGLSEWRYCAVEPPTGREHSENPNFSQSGDAHNSLILSPAMHSNASCSGEPRTAEESHSLSSSQTQRGCLFWQFVLQPLSSVAYLRSALNHRDGEGLGGLLMVVILQVQVQEAVETVFATALWWKYPHDGLADLT